MKELIGKKVKKIFIDSNLQHWLKFETDQGDLHYYADGDCCSESYFAEILGVNNLLNVKNEDGIINVEEMSLGSGEGTRQESDEIYGFRIVTDMPDWSDSYSSSLVIFRNSSNGYYGGSCLYVDIGDENNRLYSLNKSSIENVKWMEIKRDYRE